MRLPTTWLHSDCFVKHLWELPQTQESIKSVWRLQILHLETHLEHMVLVISRHYISSQECSRMFKKVPESSRKFKKILECSRMHADP